MADRSVNITLTARVAGLVSGLKTAQKASADYGKSLAAQAKAHRSEWESAGRTLTGFGAATVAGLGLATKAAMSWESAWTGVLKTVDGSADQLERLEGDLREMARTLPASHTEIAAVAEAAGQLGVHVDDVAEFTRTMIDLGETTNLSAEEAATSLARFTNIMGTSQDKVSNLGASVVGLGNNFATTEREIVELSMRLAGAGKQANLSEGEVLGLAAAMSSVGIEAEAGGTAMTLTMKRISREVELGGDKLGLFAQVAGMSAEDFSKAWREDAAGTLSTFVAGLSETEAMGMSTIGVLTELGVTGVRESDALLRLSSAQDVLNDALAMGNSEYEANTALIIEASKRYETAESRVKAAGNALNDAAIDIGAMILPALADLADGVADVAGWFQSLPDPVKGAATGLAGAAGAASLAAGSFLLVFPRVMDTVGAFKELQKLNPKVASGLGKVGKAAGIAGAAVGVVYLTDMLVNLADGSGRARMGVEEITTALLDLDAAAIAAEFTAKNVDSMTEALDALTGQGGITRKLDLWASKLDDVFSSTFVSSVSDSRLAFESIDQALANLVAGGRADLAAQSLELLYGQVDQTRYSIDDLKAQLPGYRDALAGVANDARLVAEETASQDRALDRLADGYRTGTASAEEYSGALRELIDLKREASGVALSERDAQRQLEAAWDDARKALKENGATLDITTRKGRDNQAALDDIASSGWDLVEAMEANGASQEDMQAVLERTREDFVKMARRMGMSKDEAKALADQLGLFPENIDVAIAVETDTAQRNFERWITDNNGRRIKVSVDTVQGTTFRYSPTGPIARAGGGKLPGAPSSTDNMLINAASGEWVINARSSQKYDSLLAAINADALPGFASGGRVGASAEEKKRIEDEKRRAREEMERRRRLRELERQLRLEMERGTLIGGAAGSLSGGYGLVDDIRDLARSGDVSGRQKSRLLKAAREAEKAFKALNKEAGSIERKLDKAADTVQRLTSIRDSVKNSLMGEQSLADSIVRGQTSVGAYGRQSTARDSVTAKSLVASAKAKAAKIKKFSQKLKKLAKLGTSGPILEEIAMLGSDEGSLVADALLAGGKSAINQLNAAYAEIERYAKKSGNYVTEGFEEGGLKAARALVKELKAQQKEIDNALKAAAKKAAEEYMRIVEKASKKGAASASAAATSAPLVRGAAPASSPFSGPLTVEVTLSTDKRFAGVVVRDGIQEVARSDRAILRRAVGV